MRFGHQAGSHWVVMDVLHAAVDLLVGVQLQRLVILPPELIGGVVAVRCSSLTEGPQHPFAPAFASMLFDRTDDLFGRVLLVIAHDVRQVVAIGRTHDQVDVVAHDHPFEQAKAFLLLAMPKAVDHDVPVFPTGEDIHPAYRGVGDEVDTFGIMEFVGPAHGLTKMEQGGPVANWPMSFRPARCSDGCSQVIPTRLANASPAREHLREIRLGPDHNYFWTEVLANRLSAHYFGMTRSQWLFFTGGEYPLDFQNYDWFDLLDP